MPVENGGGILWRVKDEKNHRVTGTTGYLWIEREVAAYRESLGELHTDMSYFDKLKNDAIAAIEKFVPYEELVS
jgi:hypothetical protein